MRAQITLYIIIGVMAVLFLGTTTYVVNKYFFKPPAVVVQFPELSNYITDCLKSTGRDAVRLLGLYGGYIDPSKHGVSMAADSLEGDALMLEETPVVYWWYLKSKNKCADCKLSSELMPTADSIVSQINEYVRANLEDCTAGFPQFAKQGYHISTGSAAVSTELTKKDVRLHLSWPVIATKQNSQITIQEFAATLQVPLSQLYSLASNITLEEKTKAVLETLLLHAIGSYTDVSPDKLPPFSAVTNEVRIVSWNKGLVEQNIYPVFEGMIPAITYGQRTAEQNLSVEKSALASLRFAGEEVPFDVSFHYFGWPFYFDITPSAGSNLLPDVVRSRFPMNLAPPFQTNYYEFFYDISVPLLVELRDKNAYNGDGYSFFFAMEANIRDNKPMHAFNTGEGTIGQFTAPEVTPEIEIPRVKVEVCTGENNTFYCPMNNKNYSTLLDCQKECQRTEMSKQNITFNATFFCNPEQQVSGTTKIAVSDARDNSPIPEALLTYGCGRIANCMMPSSNSRGIIRTKLPLCYNGYMRVEKKGYHPFVGLYTTEFEKRDEINITLQSLRKFGVVVKKYQTNGTDIVGTARSLMPNEQVVIMLDRLKESPVEDAFSARVQIEGPSAAVIDLIPGKYDVKGLFVDKTGFMLPAECIMFCEHFDDEGKCKGFKRTPEKSQKISPAMLGGVMLNNKTGYFELSSFDLDKSGKNTLEFNLVRLRTPTCIAKENCILPDCVGLEEMGRTEEYSQKFRKQLEPKLVVR